MIQLFSREPACEYCGSAHPQAQLCHARPGLSRRSFLFLAGAAAATAIVAPKLLLEPAYKGRLPQCYGRIHIPAEVIAMQRQMNGLQSLIFDTTISGGYLGMSRVA